MYNLNESLKWTDWTMSAYCDKIKSYIGAFFQSTLTSPTPGNFFGLAVDITAIGDIRTLVVGARLGDVGEVNSGTIYTYTSAGTTWSLEQTIENPNPEKNDYFGYAVNIYGNTMAASIPNNGGGKVRVYTRTDSVWNLEQSISSLTELATAFGYSVSLYEDTIVISAHTADVGEIIQGGIVHIYTRSGTTWTLEQTIENPSPVDYDTFGRSVDINNNTLIIGTGYKDDYGNNSGVAYIYTRAGTTWTLEETLYSPDAAESDYFGSNVSIDEFSGVTSVIIGAYGNTPASIENSGSAYIYTRSGTTWTHEQTIDNPNINDPSHFGTTVNIHGYICIITASYDNSDENLSGTSYVYKRIGGVWELLQTLKQPDEIVASSYFGSASSLNGDVFVISSPNQSKAFTYKLG